mmetsp:Transcript_32740/g.77201  ORF Transcript_32740/g.77201 Transcript_32740/m.77201 type:complete len:209 (+) Transcript_32740:817-1443(+)
MASNWIRFESGFRSPTLLTLLGVVVSSFARFGTVPAVSGASAGSDRDSGDGMDAIAFVVVVVVVAVVVALVEGLSKRGDGGTKEAIFPMGVPSLSPSIQAAKSSLSSFLSLLPLFFVPVVSDRSMITVVVPFSGLLLIFWSENASMMSLPSFSPLLPFLKEKRKREVDEGFVGYTDRSGSESEFDHGFLPINDQEDPECRRTEKASAE